MKMYQLKVTAVDELTGLEEDTLIGYNSDRGLLVETCATFMGMDYDSIDFYQLPLTALAKEPEYYWTNNSGTYALIKGIN